MGSVSKSDSDVQMEDRLTVELLTQCKLLLNKLTLVTREEEKIYLTFPDGLPDQVELAAGRFQQENQGFGSLDYLNK